jgi:phosphohistidine phosphatase
MPRQLLVLRHAKSAWDTDAPSDFERPLAKRGRKDAPRMGEWLRENGLAPDYVVSSPAARARETALMACKALGFKEDRVVWDGRIYEGGLSGLLAVLAGCPDKAARVMLVGHSPGVETLVRYLGGDAVDEPPDGKLLPTGTVACLDMPKSWKTLEEGSGTVVSITRPKALQG